MDQGTIYEAIEEYLSGTTRMVVDISRFKAREAETKFPYPHDTAEIHAQVLRAMHREGAAEDIENAAALLKELSE